MRLKHRIYDWLLDYVLRNHPMARNCNIVSYANEELKRAGFDAPDADYGGMLYDAVMRSVRLFSIEGHSGFSAGYAMNLTSQCCKFRPLSPLTGDDDEWIEIADGEYQNRRMSSIFKDGKDGEAYWIDGKVFQEPSGATFTSFDSRVPVKFPWSWREPEIVKVAHD